MASPLDSRLSPFSFEVPDAQIAQTPAPARDGARLLEVGPGSGRLAHHGFRDLPALLPKGALVVVNDTRVIPARLRTRKPSGGRHEVLLLSPNGRASTGADADAAVFGARDTSLAGDANTVAFAARDASLAGADTVALGACDASFAGADTVALGARDAHAHSAVWSCLVRGQVTPGTWLTVEPPLGRSPSGEPPRVRFLERRDDGTALVELGSALTDYEAWGEEPLPPYIRRPKGLTADDRERYQTTFARVAGAAAAPTAGLHFTPAVVAALAARDIAVVPVTLHVGLGTFSPLRPEQLETGELHREPYDVPAQTAAAVNAARARGAPIVAVGTTVVRTLESAWTDSGLRAGPGATRLFIRTGYTFRGVDLLVTNFHLPESSLLWLVAAFAGADTMAGAYAAALSHGYRFFSYGDSSLLHPQTPRARVITSP